MQKLLDPEAEQRNYDAPGNIDSDPLEALYNAPSADTSGSSRIADAKELEALYNTPSADTSGSSRLADAKELANREADSGDDSAYGPSALDDFRARGLNYTGGKDGQELKFKSSSNMKKRLSIAATALGVGAGSATIFFMTMLPLKIMSMVNMIESRAFAATASALENAENRLVSDYIAKHVMSALGTPGCKKTIDPTCVVTVNGDGPVSKLYKAWSQNKLQYELATKYGIVIGKENGKFIMSINGHSVGNDAQFNDLRSGKITLADLDGKEVGRKEIRHAVRNAVKEGTKWDRTYKRYQYGNMLHKRYGLWRCVIICDPLDDFLDAYDAKVLSGKARVIQKVSGVVGQSYGLILECISDPKFCDTKISPTTDGTEPKSEVQKNLESKMTAYRAAHGSEKLATLVERAKGISELGPGGYLTREIVGSLADRFGGDLVTKEAAKKAVSKAIPIVGWIAFGVQVEQFVYHAPGFIRGVRYATSATAAASTFVMYQSAAAEVRRGHDDMTELGALSDTLSDGQDMTSHPMYGIYSEKPTVVSAPSLIASLFSGRASASTPTGYSFKCDDGSPVPAGKLICPEEDFLNAGPLINLVTAAEKNEYLSTIFSKPFYDFINSILGAVLQVWNGLLSIPTTIMMWSGCTQLDAANSVGDYLTGVFSGGKVTKNPYTVSCKQIEQWIGEQAQGIIKWLADGLLPNQWLNLSGGRLFSMSIAGAEVTAEKSATLSLGASGLTDSQYLGIQNQRIQDDEYDFNHKSFYARVTDRDTPYSLVSRVAMGVPGPSSLADRSIASIFTNPFSRIGSAIASLSPQKTAFAALPASSASPFGIKHVGYTDAQIPSDPEGYWNSNCEGRDYVKDYMSSMEQDPDTAEAMPTKPEPCMLLATAISVGGAMFDASFIPADAANNSPPGAAGSSIDTANLFNASDSVSCASGTNDLGVQDGYSDGKKVAIRVCAIPGFASSSSESNPGNSFFIQGAGGDVVVNSRVSGAWLALFNAAKASGVTMSAASGFRSNSHQSQLCGGTCDGSMVARPGYSPHQMGLAIDFNGPTASNGGAQTCAARVTQPGNPTWDWLEKNAAKFGFKQYSAESWHWDPLPMPNRCGGGT